MTLFRLYLSPDWRRPSPRWGFQLGCDPNRRIIAGAAFLSLGLMALWVAMKSWVEWRKKYKNGDRVKW